MSIIAILFVRKVKDETITEELTLKSQALTNLLYIKSDIKNNSFKVFKEKYSLSDSSKNSYHIMFKRALYYENSDSVLNDYIFTLKGKNIDAKDSFYIKKLKKLHEARESYYFYLRKIHYQLVNTNKQKLFNPKAEPIYLF